MLFFLGDFFFFISHDLEVVYLVKAPLGEICLDHQGLVFRLQGSSTMEDMQEKARVFWVERWQLLVHKTPSFGAFQLVMGIPLYRWMVF